jgi:hypothetical protein
VLVRWTSSYVANGRGERVLVQPVGGTPPEDKR